MQLSCLLAVSHIKVRMSTKSGFDGLRSILEPPCFKHRHILRNLHHNDGPFPRSLLPMDGIQRALRVGLLPLRLNADQSIGDRTAPIDVVGDVLMEGLSLRE